MEGLLYVSFVVVIALLAYQNMSIRSSIKRLSNTRSVVLKSAQLHSAMEIEFERARRLNYSFSIVVINIVERVVWNASPDAVLRILADEGASLESDRSPPGTINIFRSSSDIAVKLRSTDTAVYDDEKNRFILLLVGTRKHDAERIAGRVTDRLAKGLQQEVAYGCAEFPEDALFLDDLIARAERRKVGRNHATDAAAESLAS